MCLFYKECGNKILSILIRISGKGYVSRRLAESHFLRYFCSQDELGKLILFAL